MGFVVVVNLRLVSNTKHLSASDRQGASLCVQLSRRAGRSHTPNVAGTDAYNLHFVVLSSGAMVLVL